MSERPRILILGAQGRIGRAAALAFAQAGWQVHAQARRPAPGITLVAPLEDTAALATAAAGARWVLYAVNPPYTRWDRELMPLARAGMAVAERLGARLLLPGNVYNHGTELPERLLPDTPMRPDTPKARQRCALEDELAARAAAGRLRSTVLRAGDFFGPATGTWIDLVIAKGLARRRLVYPGPTDRVHAWAYLPDLAQAMVALAAAPEGPAHERLHFAGHSPTGAELLAALERAAATLGLAGPWRHGRFPWPLIRAAGWVWPMGRELARMAYLWERPHALDGSALAARVGPLATTPLEAALRDRLQLLLPQPAPSGGSAVAPARPR